MTHLKVTLHRELGHFSSTSIYKGQSEKDISDRNLVQSIQVLKMFAYRLRQNYNNVLQHDIPVHVFLATKEWKNIRP
jgi:hypothetical protein